jgi:putative ABC transport system permease protein
MRGDGEIIFYPVKISKIRVMIRNYLKTAWRNLLKYRGSSLINILGLAIGVTACMIIFIYARFELSFDRYNVNADRIARVTTTVHAPESDLVFATSPSLLADAIKRDYPEVADIVRLENDPKLIKTDNGLFREEGIYKADASVWSIFSFDFLEGSPASALKDPASIVLTASIEKKYFGSAPALGRTMICDGQPLRVTAVVKDRPANSDIRIDGLVPADRTVARSWMDDFSDYTFILFDRKPDLKGFEHKLAAISAKYIQPELNATGGSNYRVFFELEPLAGVHFSQGKLLDTPKGNKRSAYIFSLLALFILVIALLNYINLSTARSADRAREVGIRKVSGALRSQLMIQFLFESFFVMLIAWMGSLVLIVVALPFFNRLFTMNLSIEWTRDLPLMGVLFLISLLLAGSYPALVLSAFRPILVLKGNWRHSVKGVFLRKAVTFTQFALAAALILGTTVIYRQMRFIEQKDLGYNKDQLLNVFLPADSSSLPAVRAFGDALRRRPEIHGFTLGNGMTDRGAALSSTIVRSQGAKRDLMCIYYVVDPDFLPVFQIRLLEGRNLSDSFPTDRKQGFLVNEALVRTMGWKTALGQSIEGFGHKGKIVGVVRDFYYKSLHNAVEPLVMIYNDKSVTDVLTVRVRPADLPVVRGLFAANFPSILFDYSFFDEMVSKQYEEDRVTMSLFNDFTMLAILVSCLGLYGLVALIAVQRTREIGIRKVLGASVDQLLILMARDFLWIAFWALLVALPVAALVMKKWLNSYAYHVPISWQMFLIPALVIPSIALIVIARDTVRTAIANPVKSLRME